MAQEHKIKIDGISVKEIRCKNDNCRKLICYESIKVGTLIHVCPRCDFISKFQIGYSEAAQNFISELKTKFEDQKGGEKING